MLILHCTTYLSCVGYSHCVSSSSSSSTIWYPCREGDTRAHQIYIHGEMETMTIVYYNNYDISLQQITLMGNNSAREAGGEGFYTLRLLQHCNVCRLFIFCHDQFINHDYLFLLMRMILLFMWYVRAKVLTVIIVDPYACTYAHV